MQIGVDGWRQSRTGLRSLSRLFNSAIAIVVCLTFLIRPRMVLAVEPVPSAFWSPFALRPSYVPATSWSNVTGVGGGAADANGPAPAADSYLRIGTAPPPSRHHRPGNDNNKKEGEELSWTDPESAGNMVRWYRLYNRCTGGYVQMYMNEINARSKYASPFADLRVESDSYGSRIRIQSQKFNKYLCFNRRQRITSKYNGRSERCVFVEKFADNQYTELESAWRPGLYLGFNRGDGRFLDPARYYTDRRVCFQFIKHENFTVQPQLDVAQIDRNADDPQTATANRRHRLRHRHRHR